MQCAGPSRRLRCRGLLYLVPFHFTADSRCETKMCDVPRATVELVISRFVWHNPLEVSEKVSDLVWRRGWSRQAPRRAPTALALRHCFRISSLND